MSLKINRRERALIKEALRLLNEAEEDAVGGSENQETEQLQDPVDTSSSSSQTGRAQMEREVLTFVAKEITKAVKAKDVKGIVDTIGKFTAKAADQKIGNIEATADDLRTAMVHILCTAGDSDDQAWTKSKAVEDVSCENLVPTQNTIDLYKSAGFPLSTYVAPPGGPSKGFSALVWEMTNDDPALTDSRDGKKVGSIATIKFGNDHFILDGHHRWSAKACKKGAAGTVKATTLVLPPAGIVTGKLLSFRL